jgi:hypothetical protein
MNAKYKAPHKVALIDSNGTVLGVRELKPISAHGFDSYRYKNRLYPGYWNGRICTQSVQAFIKVKYITH